jgi:hypothetical protein
MRSQVLKPEKAAEVVTAYAASNSLSRRVDVQALQEFLKAAGV